MALSISFYLNKFNAANNKYKIYARIIKDRRKAEFSLDYWIEEKNWDASKQRAKRNNFINRHLIYVENKIFEIERELGYSGKESSAKKLKDIYQGKQVMQYSLISFLDEYLELMKNSPDHKDGTFKNYQKSFNHVKRFLEYTQKQDVTLKGIDTDIILKLDHFLINHKSRISKKLLTRDYVNKIHERLRTALKKAEARDLIGSNPYKHFNLKYENKNKRETLTKEEITKLRQSELSGNENFKRIRDIFVFAIYTGLRYSDILELKPEDIIEYDGKLWFRKDQVKTEDEVNIPLFKPAVEIYYQYLNNDYCKQIGNLLPAITNQKFNIYIKEIANIAGIKKNLTFHVARHTFATTILLENGVSIEDTSKLLGHKNLKTTQIYGKINRDRLNRVWEEVNDKFE